MLTKNELAVNAQEVDKAWKCAGRRVAWVVNTVPPCAYFADLLRPSLKALLVGTGTIIRLIRAEKRR